MDKPRKFRGRLSSFQIIILGFVAVTLLGALILMLPISAKSRTVTPFHEALFTSTSAVCVTGLVVRDTATHWSAFGQAVILVLIQIGGLGVVTVAASLALLSKRKFTLMQRSTMQEAIAAPKMGGIVRLTKFILITTALIEFVGALAMMPVFCRDFGAKGVWMAVFHSVSAFCNAGFDILGTPDAPYASLTSYAGSPTVNITVMLLLIVGGLGFLTWEDIRVNRHHFKKYRVQSKIILVTTAVLIVFPALLFFFSDFSELSGKERVLSSVFQAVTPRTAGFNTADLSAMTEIGRAVMIVLMLIGGSPGSTAGGMKTTTFSVLMLNALATFRRKKDAEVFGRTVDVGTVKNAATVLVMYVALFLGGAIVLSAGEGLPLGTCLFEAASAAGTVGLTLGVTPGLGVLSQAVLIVLMFVGRVGGLTLMFAALSGTGRNSSKLPLEKITVG